MNATTVVALTALAIPAGGWGQSLADRVAAAPDGRIRMTFDARPGVCGNGSNLTFNTDRRERDWDCDAGPVRVVLTKSAGTIVRVRTYVGGRWRPGTASVTDLGTVPAPEGANVLLGLVERGSGRAARDAVLPATIARGADPWPTLLRVARRDDTSSRLRRQVMQSVGMAAGRVVRETGTSNLDRDDRAVRERAVFAVSQLPRDDGVPILLDVARNHRDPIIRSRALFWLGQTGDERALDLFEEILRRRG